MRVRGPDHSPAPPANPSAAPTGTKHIRAAASAMSASMAMSSQGQPLRDPGGCSPYAVAASTASLNPAAARHSARAAPASAGSPRMAHARPRSARRLAADAAMWMGAAQQKEGVKSRAWIGWGWGWAGVGRNRICRGDGAPRRAAPLAGASRAQAAPSRAPRPPAWSDPLSTCGWPAPPRAPRAPSPNGRAPTWRRAQAA
jgi:hypothetical protein